MPWYGDHTFHYCIWGHCFLMGQRKCSFLSSWLLHKWLSHGMSCCTSGLSKIVGWFPRRVYSTSPFLCSTLGFPALLDSFSSDAPFLHNCNKSSLECSFQNVSSYTSGTKRPMWFWGGTNVCLFSLKSVYVSQPWSSAPNPFFSLKCYIKPRSFKDSRSWRPRSRWSLILRTFRHKESFCPIFLTILDIYFHL